MPATGGALRDSLPANTTYVANSLTLNGQPLGPDGGVSPLIAGLGVNSSDGPAPGRLTEGQSAVVRFDLLVNNGVPPGTLITNQAIVDTAELPNLLTDGDGNPATGPEPTVVVVGDVQQLRIAKSVSVVGGGPALAGATLEYVVQVNNIGAVPAYEVVIRDDLDATPGYLQYVAGSATMNGSVNGVVVAGQLLTGDYSTIYGPLQPGRAITFRFRAVLNANLGIGTRVTNTGTVYWNDPVQQASASVAIDVGGIPGVGLVNGRVWHDADFDNVFDANELPLAGWDVELYLNGSLAHTARTAADGIYRMSGVEPNYATTDTYELRFRRPGAVTTTALLGRADSAFTNDLQRITDIVVMSGSNLQNLNLPIDPNGIVYDALSRLAVAGSTVTLASTSGTALPSSCFYDANQQSQITLADGYYKFDLSFADPACPSGGSYLLQVTPPSSRYLPGVSAIIPPQSSATTAAFIVPSCPTSVDDAVPATAQYCEATPSELQPPASVVPGTSGTTYYLYLTLDSSLVPGSSQIFNNHIPLDLDLDESVTITKTTPMVDVARGQLVPYVITIANGVGVNLSDVTVVDRFPAGFRYVEGSARLDGEPREPVVAGRELAWPGLTVTTDGRHTLMLVLAVGSGVGEGEFVNRAQAMSAFTGNPLSVEASATVRIVPDPALDCTDVIGKVFDDANRNGLQEEGEQGIPQVRLATARGLLATTDQFGRFHITCAITPHEDRGTNFVLKLDDRTLPSGFRASTSNLQVQRATRGKALEFNFGASIHRVIGLDLADPVFEPGSIEIRPLWLPRLELLMTELRAAPAVLRLSYLADEQPARRRALESAAPADRPGMASDRRRSELRAPDRARGVLAPRRAGRCARAPRRITMTRRERIACVLLAALLASAAASAQLLREPSRGEAVERQLPGDRTFTQWVLDPNLVNTSGGDRFESREVAAEELETVKLTNLVPPIRFEVGVAQVPDATVVELRRILEGLRDRRNVRLHLVGHADNQRLGPALAAVFGDNEGLSRERAGEVAEFLKRSLELPPEAIAYEWAGDTKPIASNATADGRAQNRRVEVEVWYDEPKAGSALQEVLVKDDFRRVKVCRTETVCRLRYVDGQSGARACRTLVAPRSFRGADRRDPEFVAQVGVRCAT